MASAEKTRLLYGFQLAGRLPSRTLQDGSLITMFIPCLVTCPLRLALNGGHFGTPTHVLVCEMWCFDLAVYVVKALNVWRSK
jgi:hypothetical protein